MPQPQGARLPAPRLDPPHAAKAIQPRMMFSDNSKKGPADCNRQRRQCYAHPDGEEELTHPMMKNTSDFYKHVRDYLGGAKP